jgi:nucleotide-binding universal stress UspA family protein
MVVPEQASFSGFKNVVYASNLDHIDKELKAILPYLEVFGSHLHILHIRKKGTDIEKVKETIAKAWKRIGYKKITVSITDGEEVDKSIDTYVHKVKADLLAMFTHEKSFYEKLFNRSITKRVAFQSSVPLLAFRLRT